MTFRILSKLINAMRVGKNNIQYKSISLIFILFFGAFFVDVQLIWSQNVVAPSIQQIELKDPVNTVDLDTILKRYKVEQVDPQTNKQVNWHPGDTFEHSAWSEKAVEMWFDNCDEWVQGLNRKTAAIAAYLHDIGKGGDMEYRYLWKESHPEVGFKQLLDQKDFNYLSNSDFEKVKKDAYAKIPTPNSPEPAVSLPKDIKINEFDFTKWFREHNVNSDEQKLIAITVGIHYQFGLVLKEISEIEKNKSTDTKENIFKKFLDKLKDLTKETNYNCGIITEEQVKLAIMIGAADLRGTDEVDYPSKVIGTLPDKITIPEGKIKFKNGEAPYDLYGLEVKGKKIRKEILNYFNSDYNVRYN